MTTAKFKTVTEKYIIVVYHRLSPIYYYIFFSIWLFFILNYFHINIHHKHNDICNNNANNNKKNHWNIKEQIKYQEKLV